MLLQSFFLSPPDERSEMNVFDLEQFFPNEIQQLQSGKELSNPEADPIIVRILNSLADREDMPEARRHQLQKWLEGIRYASYLRPAPAPSLEPNPIRL